MTLFKQKYNEIYTLIDNQCNNANVIMQTISQAVNGYTLKYMQHISVAPYLSKSYSKVNAGDHVMLANKISLNSLPMTFANTNTDCSF